MKIVEVSGELLEELRSVGIETYRQHFSDIWSEEGLNSYLESQFSIPKLQSDLSGDIVKYFLAFVEERAVGFLKLKKGQSLPVNDFESGLEIEKIYLLRDFAGIGLGKELIDFVIDYAGNLHEKIVWLDVLKINSRGVGFYEKQGFKIVGELEFSTDIRRTDMWVMRYEVERK